MKIKTKNIKIEVRNQSYRMVKHRNKTQKGEPGHTKNREK